MTDGLKFRTLPAEEQPMEEDIRTADGIFIKRVAALEAGTYLPQHAHVWDHTTLLTNGRIEVWQGSLVDWVGAATIYQAPAAIFIKAGVKHLFRILEDNTVLWCIHNLKGAQAVEVLEEHDLLDEVS